MTPSRLASLILLSFILSVSGVVAQSDDDVVKVDSSVVVVNATITDANGRHAAGLKENQFSIFENGVQQDINFFAAEETPFAAVILLDTSGSMESRVSLA